MEIGVRRNGERDGPALPGVLCGRAARAMRSWRRKEDALS